MLRISLFGNLEVQSSIGPVGNFPTDSSRRLFAFLVLHRGRRYSREALASHFWQCRAKSTALKYLRAELWRMRKAVEVSGVPSCIHASRHEVGFNQAALHWIDSQEFEGRIVPLSCRSGEDLEESEAHLLRQSVDLYRGDLLEDVYDDWAVIYRQRMRELFLQALEILIRFNAVKSAWSEAVVYAQRLLSIDPLREHIQRQLIRFHYLRGDRAAAMQQYALCRDLLARELDVQPMAETQELNRSIVAQQPASSAVFRPRERMRRPTVRHPSDGVIDDRHGVFGNADIVLPADGAGLSSQQILDAALEEVARAEQRIARARNLIQSIREKHPSPESD